MNIDLSDDMIYRIMYENFKSTGKMDINSIKKALENKGLDIDQKSIESRIRYFYENASQEDQEKLLGL
jgi:hypothetical protein